MNRRTKVKIPRQQEAYAPREQPNEVAAILCVSLACLMLAGVWLDHRGWVPQLVASLFRLLGVGAWYVVVSLVLAARKKLKGKALVPTGAHFFGWIALFPLIAGVVQGLSRVSADLASRCAHGGVMAKLLGVFASDGNPGGSVGRIVHNLFASLLGLYSGTILSFGLMMSLVVAFSEVSLMEFLTGTATFAYAALRWAAFGVAVPTAWLGRAVWTGVMTLHGLIFVLLKDLVTFALRLSELAGHMREQTDSMQGELATPAGTPTMYFVPTPEGPQDVRRPEYLKPEGPMVVPLTVPRPNVPAQPKPEAPARTVKFRDVAAMLATPAPFVPEKAVVPPPVVSPPTVKRNAEEPVAEAPVARPVEKPVEAPVMKAPEPRAERAPAAIEAPVMKAAPVVEAPVVKAAPVVEAPVVKAASIVEPPVELAPMIIKKAAPLVLAPPVVEVETAVTPGHDDPETEEESSDTTTDESVQILVSPTAAATTTETVITGEDAPEAQALPGKAPASQMKTATAGGPIFIRSESRRDPFVLAPPPKELFNPPVPADPRQESEEELRTKASQIVDTLRQFRIDSEVTHITQGPSVTQFELRPAAGVKLSTISALSNNLAMELATKAIRIEAPIPGKQAVGIEVPNRYMTKVPFQKMLASPKFQDSKSVLSFAVGEDITGEPVIADLARMPHLLVAGSTNSGKSVCINAILCSILARARPHEVKFILIDPKRVELSVYEDIPHLVTQVVTDSNDASHALKWAVMEMERRYQFLSRLGFRNIKGYNEALAAGKLISPPDMDLPDLPMPYIVVIIDELADLMMVAKKEVEESIVRLTQMARAVGIHVIVATQRPSVNVITGIIKANMPSRIAFAVASKVDSKVIIDAIGAEKLLGFGDMLYMPVGEQRATRIQGAFVDDEEVKRLCAYLKQAGPPEYCDIVGEVVEKTARAADDSFHDDMWESCLRLALERSEVSTSMLQTHLKIGYNRAARIVEEMEARRLISGQETGKRRHVLFSHADLSKHI